MKERHQAIEGAQQTGRVGKNSQIILPYTRRRRHTEIFFSLENF
jgi:hypothetical protein